MNARTVVLAAALAAGSAAFQAAAGGGGSPSREIVRATGDQLLAAVLTDVLERNPSIAAAEATAEAIAHKAPQRSSLPDPTVQLTAFLLPPETRVGPQRAVASLSQRLPGGSKRSLGEASALRAAEAARADVEALRLRLTVEGRRLYHEIGYLDAATRSLESDRAILTHFEELARARYAAGSGLQQEVIAVQADISRLDARLAEVAERRAARVADLNAIRDRRGAALTPHHPPEVPAVADLSWETLRERALSRRPELRAAAARIEAAQTEIELADASGAPDFTVGLTYAWVDRRSDVDVADNGQDVFGVTGGISLPVWRGVVEAGVEEASQRRLAAEARWRAAVAEIDRELESVRGRLGEILRRVRLFEGTLRVQAEHALQSAEAAYAAGRIDAVALLDSERTLLDVRLSSARARTDLAIAVAELEAAVAGPLDMASAGSGESTASEGPEATGAEFEIRNSEFGMPFPEHFAGAAAGGGS
jgi:outer membrane protein TolC